MLEKNGAVSVDKKIEREFFFLPNDIFVKHFRKHLGPTDLKNNWNCYLSNNGNLRKEGLYFAVNFKLK